MNKTSNTSNNKSISIKVNPTTETVDAQFELEKKRLAKKRDLRTKQYDEYRILFYGSPKEKEEVRYKTYYEIWICTNNQRPKKLKKVFHYTVLFLLA